MTTSQQEIPDSDLQDQINALRNYGNTGYKQSMSILRMWKNAKLTSDQLNTLLPGPWLAQVEKMNPADPDEKEFKREMASLLQELNAQYNKLKGGAQNDENQRNENIPADTALNLEFKTSLDEKIFKQPLSEAKGDQSAEIPKHLRDFTVKQIEKELLSDFKNDPAAKEEAKPVARQKAEEIEKAVEDEVKGNEEAFRVEARNVTNFLLTKKHDELRQSLLKGEIPAQEFVAHKEAYLHNDAKGVIDYKEKRAYMDVNLDSDRTIIGENELYKCDKCGSRKITKVEKQMDAAENESTSIYYCADCDTTEQFQGK